MFFWKLSSSQFLPNSKLSFKIIIFLFLFLIFVLQSRVSLEVYLTFEISNYILLNIFIFKVGCIPCLLYIASGSSTDWAHGDALIPYTTSMELRDTGQN